MTLVVRPDTHSPPRDPHEYYDRPRLPQLQIETVDGHRAVWITATQQPGVNVERVRDAAWREMDALAATLPASITRRGEPLR